MKGQVIPAISYYFDKVQALIDRSLFHDNHFVLWTDGGPTNCEL